MDQLQSDLTSRGLDFSILPKELHQLILHSTSMYADLSPDKRKEFIEKFIDILADAENNISSLKNEVGMTNFTDRTQTLINSLKINIENQQTYKLRKELYESAWLNEDPSKNGVMSQILMAVIDEFVVSLGDMVIDMYKVINEKWASYVLRELKNTIFSGAVWEAVGKELGWGMMDLFGNWDNSKDDLIYKKMRQSLIALWIWILLKSIWKKLIKTIAKKSITVAAK